MYSGARARQARRGGGGKRALTLNVVATRCEGASANTSTGDSSVTNLLFYRLTVTDVSPEVRTTPLCQSFASQALSSRVAAAGGERARGMRPSRHTIFEERYLRTLTGVTFDVGKH